MEEFERIKALCQEAITSNIKNTSIIKQWKFEIRSSLMKIRARFNEQIDQFIDKFSKAFKNIESSNELIEYQGEDKRLQLQVEEIQKKYMEILKIFNNISS